MNREKWNRLANRFEDEVCDIAATDRNHVLQRLMSKVRPSQRRSVLVDLGCGIGTFIRQFGSLFKEVVGVDVAPRMVARTKDCCSRLPQLRWLCMDIQRVPRVVGSCADLTACLNVITSSVATRRDAQWASVTAITKPGGFALIVVPSIESAHLVANLKDNGRKARHQSAELNRGLVRCGNDLQKYYSRSELRTTMAHHGLMVDTIRRVFYPWTEEGVPRQRAPATLYPWDWACLARRPGRAA